MLGHRTACTVLTTVITPAVHHFVASAPFSHYSWTRYADELA